MGIHVNLEDEDGQALDTVGDPTNILHRVLPGVDDPEFHHANRIDWYGDTTFNRRQATDLIGELTIVRARCAVAGDTDLIDRILALARRCEAKAHLYLKFYGD